jgi:hypothetical protein
MLFALLNSVTLDPSALSDMRYIIGGVGGIIAIFLSNLFALLLKNNSIKKSIKTSQKETHKIIEELGENLTGRIDDLEEVTNKINQIADGLESLEHVYENSLRFAKKLFTKDNCILVSNAITHKHNNFKLLIKEFVNSIDHLHEEAFRQKLQVHMRLCRIFTADLLGKDFTDSWYEKNFELYHEYIDKVSEKIFDKDNPKNKFNNIIQRFIRISAELEEDLLGGVLLEWGIFNKEVSSADFNRGGR